MENRSANKIWKALKESGKTTLDFKSWLQREKQKGFLNFDGQNNAPINKSLNSSIQQTLDDMHKQAGYKTSADDEYIFGIKRKLLMWTGITIGVIVVGIIIIKKV